jgi:isopentenyldiphosphate isomerase
MAESELIDICDAAGHPLGVATRAEAHLRGLWHRSLHCWVAGRGALLFQRRAADRPHWPGRLDITVAGHLTAGESWQDALREAREEIGLAVGPAEVIDAGERPDELRFGQAVDRELARIVLVRCDQPLSSYRLGPEVQALVAVPLEDGRRLFRGEVSALRCRAAGEAAEETVTAADVVPRAASYYLDALALALSYRGRPSRRCDPGCR